MSTRGVVLVCDDEPQLLRGIVAVIAHAGFEPLPTRSANEALTLAPLRPPDAAVIDLLLPDGDGIEVCRSLREWSSMPIVVLSAVQEANEKIRALEAGADDYVTKPFAPRELVARLEAALRRAAPPEEEPVLRADDLELDQAAHTVRRGGEEVRLTPTEYELLRMLMPSRGQLITYRDLLEQVWGPRHGDDTKSLRTHMANLRSKLNPTGRGPRYIRTDPRVGYRFEV